MAVKDSFTVAEAALHSDLSLDMVNYLCRQKLLEPSGAPERGRGKPRVYTFGDVVMLRTLARLLQSGISVANLKHGLADLRARHDEITDKTIPSRFLVTDGQHIYFRKKQEVLEALDGSGQFVFAFVVELRQVRNEVLKAISA